MFNLDKSNAKISSLTSRVELHGDERKPAADMKLSVDVPATALNGISPGLCESLFRKPGRGDQIALIGEKKEAFTVLKHPGLEPQKLKGKFPGYEFALGQQVHDGVEEEAFFADAEVKNFTVTAREGGTAEVDFTVSISEIDDEDFSALRRLQIAGTAIVTLVPPKAQAQQDETQEAA